MNVKIWNKICDRLLLKTPNDKNKQIIQKPEEQKDKFYNLPKKRLVKPPNSYYGDLFDDVTVLEIRKVDVNLNAKYDVPESYVRFFS